MDEATPDPLLLPSEVGALLRVDPKTVTRWAKAGKIPSIRTLGGHRRFRESVVKALLASSGVLVNDDGAQADVDPGTLEDPTPEDPGA